MSDKVIIVDGRNFVFRHHYPNNGLATEDGRATSVLHGCLTGLLSLANRLSDIPIVFVWDGGGQTWRHKLLAPKPKALAVAASVSSPISAPSVFLPAIGQVVLEKPKPALKPEGYKATRDVNATAVMLNDKKTAVRQIPELLSLLDIIGIRNFKISNLEGDDLIGILTTAILERKIFEKVIIHSTDKDFYQLISPQVSVLKGIEKGTGKLQWARREEIPLKYGIRVEEWVKYRALTGDKSDNIPNFLPGVGPVTAVKWMRMGLDPSLKRFQDLPYLTKAALKDVKMPKGKGALIDWENVWDSLHRNYIASQILVDGKFDVLPETVKRGVVGMIGSLSKKAFMRKQFSDEAYRQLSERLAYWELADLLGKRDAFKVLR